MLLLLLLLKLAHAETLLFVSATGTDSLSCGSKAEPCQSLLFTIEHKVYNSTDSTTVHISSGTYTGFNNTNIQITAVPDRAAPPLKIIADNFGGAVIFDFQNVSSGWTVTDYPSDLSIIGITFRIMLDSGLAFSGSGKGSTYIVSSCTFDSGTFKTMGSSEGLDVAVSQDTFVEVNSCNFINHPGDINFSYGPLLLKSGRIKVFDCFFSNNTGRLGPLAAFNLPNHDYLYVDVSNSTFVNNYGLESAAVYSNRREKGQIFTFSNLDVRNNKAALYVIQLVDGPQTLKHSTIQDNEASSGAIGIISRDSAGIIAVTDCQIHSNVAEANAAGLFCENTPISLDGSKIQGNFIGNVSNVGAQIVCKNCPGCSDEKLKWYVIVVPVAVVGLVLFICLVVYVKRRRSTYEYLD